MRLVTYLLTTILWCLMIFFGMRLTLRAYIDRSLRKGTRKRLAKKQSFKEWFFYTRYSEIIPKWKFACYYGIFVGAVISIILDIALYTNADFQAMSNTLRVYWGFTVLAFMLSYWL